MPKLSFETGNKPRKKERLREGTSLRALRQKTFDSMDRIQEQDEKFGPREWAAPLVQLNAADAAALAKFDEMTIRQSLLEDPGVTLICKSMKCSREAAVDHIIKQVELGHMTLGVHEGKIRAGITKAGWQEVSRKLR